MAEPISAQARLDKIVTQIAGNMVAEVCSAYVLRSDGVLELFATEGLKREAVHKAALRVGEGLVGTIAKDALPLNLSDAQSHPASSTCRRPAKRSTRRSSACRFCAPGARWACSSCRTAPTAPTTRRRSRRCRPPPWCWRK
jgi:hypothetical protein